jgi:hypothetical protein
MRIVGPETILQYGVVVDPIHILYFDLFCDAGEIRLCEIEILPVMLLKSSLVGRYSVSVSG